MEGRWSHAVDAAIEATRAAHPGRTVVISFDRKSFRGWERRHFPNISRPRALMWWTPRSMRACFRTPDGRGSVKKRRRQAQHGESGPISRAIVAMTGVMPRWFVRYISRRYVAGSTLDDAVRVMHRLTEQGACFTVDVLGEEITSLDEATYFLEEYRRVMAQILEHGFDANLSIKPTAFGLLIDETVGLENIRTLVREAAEHDMFVRLDMEDHRVTDATIDVVLTLQEGLVNVGTVLKDACTDPRRHRPHGQRHRRGCRSPHLQGHLP